jgi:hypothetical protein
VFTYPVNVASNNWTVTPADFEAARRQWEYSHAITAVLTFVALVAITASVVSCKRKLAMMRARLTGRCNALGSARLKGRLTLV